MGPLLPIQNGAKKHADNTHAAFSALSEMWLLHIPELPWNPEQSSSGWKGGNRGLAQNPQPHFMCTTLQLLQRVDSGGETCL